MTVAQELPVEQEQDSSEPGIVHWYCNEAPRNLAGPTVMCCGMPDDAAGEEVGDDVEMNCPLCALANEVPYGCACWDERVL